jgi:hypothetical protein
MAEKKKMTDFHEGDRVEFRCLGYVRNVTTASVHVSLDDLDFAADMPPRCPHACSRTFPTRAR